MSNQKFKSILSQDLKKGDVFQVGKTIDSKFPIWAKITSNPHGSEVAISFDYDLVYKGKTFVYDQNVQVLKESL